MGTSSIFRRTKQASGGCRGSSRARTPTPPSATRHRVEQLAELMLLSGGVADSIGRYLPPRHNLVQRSGFLSAAAPGDPRHVALNYLAHHASELGFTSADVYQSVVTDQYTDRDTGTTHIY